MKLKKRLKKINLCLIALEERGLNLHRIQMDIRKELNEVHNHLATGIADIMEHIDMQFASLKKKKAGGRQ